MKLQTLDLIGEKAGDSRNQVHRFIRLTNLIPSLLQMVDDKKIQVGYNPEEIRVFIPHEKRVAQWSCKKSECPSYIDCKENYY